MELSNSEDFGRQSSYGFLADNRVPAIVFSYWAIKIAATTLGETGADLLSMTVDLGYAAASMIFLGFFVVFFAIKLRMGRFNPIIYWLTFTATSLVGTAASDFMDRTLGFGYALGTTVLVCLLILILAFWRYREKSISVDNIVTSNAEVYYWIAFLIANTLGTALGDFLSDTSGLGFTGGALLITGLLVVTALMHYFTNVSKVLLFWVAFVLTRPFGATFGDLLTKPLSVGGVGFGTALTSTFFAVVLIILISKEFSDHRRLAEVEE